MINVYIPCDSTVVVLAHDAAGLAGHLAVTVHDETLLRPREVHGLALGALQQFVVSVNICTFVLVKQVN